MDPGIVPAKTDQGRLEVAARSGSLTAVERRLLILVNGSRSVNDLGAFVRVGELDQALHKLFVLGFIAASGQVVVLLEPAAQGFAASGPQELERPATSPQEFTAVRAQVSRFVRKRLGEAGVPICNAVDRCNSPHQLRSLLHGIETFVGARLDPQTTQAFARHFGGLLL